MRRRFAKGIGITPSSATWTARPVEFVAEERTTESLAAYYTQLTDDQKAALQAVAMDMWEPSIGATRDGLPNGGEKIVFDRFHIMRDMTKAVDTVRKQEHREYLRMGEASPLVGTKYVWLFSDENRPEYHADTFATLQALNLKVGRAWAIKEALRTLWTYRRPAAVKRFFTRWYAWAVRSRLEPVKQVAATLKRHLDGVLRFDEGTGDLPEVIQKRVLSLAIFFGASVAWVTDHLPDGDEHTNVPCRRSPGRRRCRGDRDDPRPEDTLWNRDGGARPLPAVPPSRARRGRDGCNRVRNSDLTFRSLRRQEIVERPDFSC